MQTNHKHWMKKCIVCGRMQPMKKEQKTCSTKLYGYKCSRISAGISTNQEAINERMRKATAASIKSRREAAEKVLGNLHPVDAYQRGYRKGYNAGWIAGVKHGFNSKDKPNIRANPRFNYYDNEYKSRQERANN